MIKHVFVFLLIFSTVLGFSQEVNQIDDKGEKQGVWKKYHKNGGLRYVGEFKDDQPIGVFKYYYDTGKFQSNVTYFGKVSYANFYYPSGAVKATGKYISQKKDSVWTYYDLKGYRKSTEYYKLGSREKVWYVYYTNGNVAEEKEYIKDFENGIWNTYFEDGTFKMKAIYVNGALEGKAYYYDSNGKKKILGHFHNGHRHGRWITFNPDGSALKSEEYDMGKMTKGEPNYINEKEELHDNQNNLEMEDLFPPR